MAKIECKVENGLRPQEAYIEMRDYTGRPHFIPVPRDMLRKEGDAYYLGVWVSHIDHRNKRAAIMLPDEADSGAHQIWVKFSQLEDFEEVAS